MFVIFVFALFLNESVDNSTLLGFDIDPLYFYILKGEKIDYTQLWHTGSNL